jgi:predicted MPP superfamily phosphohydrolase
MVPRHLPRILLSHQPKSVERWAGEVALQLSGHTHGGQINPGFRPASLLMSYVAGRYTVAAGSGAVPPVPGEGPRAEPPLASTTLYVNRGYGTVGPPSRVGAPPEVTRIVLVSA